MKAPFLPEDFLKPISEDQPCGIPIRYDPEYDALCEARREEDASLPSGIWQASLKRADWDEVEKLAGQILLKKSKDLTVVAFLGEAWIYRGGLDGLAGALALMTLLAENFAESVHPLPENGDPAYRAAPIQWMIRRYSDLLFNHIPLLPDMTPPLTLRNWHDVNQVQLNAGGSEKNRKEVVEAYEKMKQALLRQPQETIRRQSKALSESSDWLARLNAWCDLRLKEDAPSFQSLQDRLLKAGRILHELLSVSAHTTEETMTSFESGEKMPTSVFPSGTDLAGREDAYRALRHVADYLARTEPHSPVPYLLYRAIEWGYKPLPELLSELISGDEQARRMWKQLGVL